MKLWKELKKISAILQNISKLKMQLRNLNKKDTKLANTISYKVELSAIWDGMNLSRFLIKTECLLTILTLF
jgi:hypothetical protein